MSALAPGAAPAAGELITINGEARPLVATDLQGLLAALGQAERRGIAVALNDAVVPRQRWAATTLRPGDRLEILVAVQGG